MKITRIAKNTTSITIRLKLLTPLVQTLLKSIPENYASYYYKENSNFNYLLSSQDTKLSATGTLSKQDKHANYRKFKPETKQKL